MAKAALKATWADTNADETITYIQISTDSKSMVPHEVDQTTKRSWMNIGSVGADVTEFPFELETPFTYVRTRVRAAKIGTRPTDWEPADGHLLQIAVDGPPINPVESVGLQIINAPEIEDPGDPVLPPPSSITDLGVAPGVADDELDVTFTAVDDGSGLAAAKYRIRFFEGTTPSIIFAAATPATDTCGTATPPSAIGDPVSCTINGLKPGTAYQVQAESYRGTIGTDAVFGGLSNIDTATTTGTEDEPLEAPQNLQPQGDTTAGLKTFSWDAVAGATSYRVRIHVYGQPYSPETVPTNYLVAGDQADTDVDATVAAGATYDWWIAGVRNGIAGPTTGGALFVAAGTPTNPTPQSLLPSPTTVEEGGVRSLTVTLTGAYNQPVTVNLQSNNVPAATVPASITIPTGQTQGSFNVVGVAGPADVDISASYNGTTRIADVTVLDAPPSGGGLWPNEPTSHSLKTDWGFPALSGSGWVNAVTPSLMSIVTNQNGPLSAPAALQARFPIGHPGGNGTGNINYTFAGQGVKQIYCGMWVKVSNPFQPHETQNKLIYFTAQGGNAHPMVCGFVGSGQPFRVWMNGQAGSNIDNRHLPGVAFVGSWNMNPSASNLNLGVWARIEIILRESTTNTSRDGIVRWWCNGTLLGNFTNVNTDQFGGYDGITINPVFGGLGPITKSQEDFIWWDHMRISGTNS